MLPLDLRVAVKRIFDSLMTRKCDQMSYLRVQPT